MTDIVQAQFNATPVTRTEAQSGPLQADSAGKILVVTTTPTGASATMVQGPAADDLAVVGNPIVIAGKYEATLNVVETGDVSTLKTDTVGRLITAEGGVYPYSAIALIAGSGNVANASAAATLTGGAATTVYLAGFEITGSGATAGLPVQVTVAGLLGGSRIYTYNFAVGALIGNNPLVVEFAPALPASAVNTAISVTCPASGAGGTNNTVVAHGYHL